MTDTTRTTVTLNKSYMSLIDELVDVFGATKAQVISNIGSEELKIYFLMTVKMILSSRSYELGKEKKNHLKNLILIIE